MPRPSESLAPSVLLPPGTGAVESPGPPFAIARAAYKVEVAWEQRMIGLFTLGYSELGGADLLAASSWSATFEGPLDDITDDVDEDGGIQIQRGRSDDLGPMQMGTATITLTDATGKYNRHNPTSPLFGLLDPLRPIRVSAFFQGQTFPLFYGFVRRIDFEPGQRFGTAQILCGDLFLRLGGDKGRKPTIAELGPSTTGAAIGAMLDAIAWTDPALRRLAVGDSIPGFSADGTATILDKTEPLLEVERGSVFISADGAAVYLDRYALQSSETVATVENEMQAVAPGTDYDSIVNRQTVTGLSGTPQTYQDDESVGRFDVVEGAAITSAYIVDDPHALDLATYIVQTRKTPAGRLWALTLSNRSPGLLEFILERELQERIAASEATSGTVGAFSIEQIQHTITRGGISHVATYALQERIGNPFRLGSSELGGTDVLPY